MMYANGSDPNTEPPARDRAIDEPATEPAEEVAEPVEEVADDPPIDDDDVAEWPAPEGLAFYTELPDREMPYPELEYPF